MDGAGQVFRAGIGINDNTEGEMRGSLHCGGKVRRPFGYAPGRDDGVWWVGENRQGQGQPQVLRLRGSQNTVRPFAQDDNFLEMVEENRQQQLQLQPQIPAG